MWQLRVVEPIGGFALLIGEYQKQPGSAEWRCFRESVFSVREYEEVPSEDSIEETIQTEIDTLSLDEKFTVTGDPLLIAREILRMIRAGGAGELELGYLDGKAVYVQVRRKEHGNDND